MRPMSAVTLPSETVPGQQTEHPRPRLQRGDGRVEITLSAATGVSRLKHLYQKDPCRALFPEPPTGDLVTAVIATTSGGITGGDRLRIDLSVREAAAAVVTTQAAEKVYRSLGDDCRVDIRVTGDSGTWLEWIPQETILFDQARLRRSTTIEAQPGAMIMAGDQLVFGRLAHGEIFKSGYLRDSWQVMCNGRLVWTDALRLDGNVTSVMTDTAGFAGMVSVATFIYVADDACGHLEVARDLLAGCQARWGATCVNSVLIVRFLSSDPRALRVAFGEFWAGFRQRVRGLPPNLPRVWHS
jgi:urease accessory protein